ncbi:uncharacterized protein LOC122060751 [Macadamia integrifolia]|uniref:uncharacterized protein LOC122060751 n=1 Tax=Macadamia integrifolia TaxID=60698 RepID=UPI001C52E6DB|nr:uncharacterized protein LOC122060751 [Macadamia integrifolia]
MATDERAGAEIVRGKESCEKFSADLKKELGFPSGVLPMGELEECGRVKSTGFVWWKCKAPYEVINVPLNNIKTSYAIETTAYVEKGKIKKINGWKAKTLVWLSIVELCLEGDKIAFKSSVGTSKSIPLINFMNEEEKKAYQK